MNCLHHTLKFQNVTQNHWKGFFIQSIQNNSMNREWHNARTHRILHWYFPRRRVLSSLTAPTPRLLFTRPLIQRWHYLYKCNWCIEDPFIAFQQPRGLFSRLRTATNAMRWIINDTEALIRIMRGDERVPCRTQSSRGKFLTQYCAFNKTFWYLILCTFVKRLNGIALDDGRPMIFRKGFNLCLHSSFNEIISGIIT